MEVGLAHRPIGKPSVWFTLGERQIKTIKNKDIISCSGKLVELETVILNEIRQNRNKEAR